MKPELTITIRQLPNPNWVAVTDASGNVTNLDTYYVDADLDVEVITVHLGRKSMRVRFKWLGKTMNRDVSAEPFFKKFQITQK